MITLGSGRGLVLAAAARRLLVLAGTILLTFEWREVRGSSFLPDFAVGSSTFNGSGCDPRREISPFALELDFPTGDCLTNNFPENRFINFTRNGVSGSFPTQGFAFACDAQNPNGLFSFSVSPDHPSCSLVDPALVVNPRVYCLNTIFLVGDIISPLSFRFDCLKPSCKPSKSLNKRQCTRRINDCQKLTVAMKWTGKGCRDPRTKRKLGDGGCQCDGYCGYQCKEACSKDRQCFWNATSASCWSKQTDLAPAAPGGPIPNCPLAPQESRGVAGGFLSNFSPA